MRAKNQLTLQVTDLDNSASGEIAATTTTIQVDDALDNRGFIDGKATRIDATTVNNVGTGRIYGDTLAIGADTLRNDTETVDSLRSDAVIAARERLDIGARDILNRDGSAVVDRAPSVVVRGGYAASSCRVPTGTSAPSDCSSASPSGQWPWPESTLMWPASFRRTNSLPQARA